MLTLFVRPRVAPICSCKSIKKSLPIRFQFNVPFAIILTKQRINIRMYRNQRISIDTIKTTSEI